MEHIIIVKKRILKTFHASQPNSHSNTHTSYIHTYNEKWMKKYQRINIERKPMAMPCIHIYENHALNDDEKKTLSSKLWIASTRWHHSMIFTCNIGVARSLVLNFYTFWMAIKCQMRLCWLLVCTLTYIFCCFRCSSVCFGIWKECQHFHSRNAISKVMKFC